MRLARKLFLVAFATIAMVAFSAQAANAVEVTNEVGGAHCGEVDATNNHVVSGGCSVEAETEDAAGQNAILRSHAAAGGEVVFSICDNTFSANIHEAGDGFIHNQVLTDVGGACGITACDEAAPSHAKVPWPATLMEFGGARALQTTFCIRPVLDPEGSSFSTCTVYVPWNDDDGAHQYEFRTLPFGPQAGPWQSRCSQNAQTSLSGHWTIHGTPIEITH